MPATAASMRRAVRRSHDRAGRIESERTASLGATAGRTGARRAISEADDLFAELDRMAEKMEGGRAHAEAAEVLDDLDLDAPSTADFDALAEPPPREELDVDAALAELKRRMGRQ